MGKAMLRFEASLSAALIVEPALRAQTATRYAAFGTLGVQVMTGLKDHSRRTDHFCPSKTQNLY